MSVDNSIYETLDDWWDPTGSLAAIHAMNPARTRYFREVLLDRFGPTLSGLRLLDVGCGGGILTEGLLELDASAVGLDLAEGALRCACSHAAARGLRPLYVRAPAERLPFPDAAFSAVLSSDFLEHVEDLGAIIKECSRVLATGGIFLYDTINRTCFTRVFYIGLVQEWRKLVPPRTHDWNYFVRPTELRAFLRDAGLTPVETQGLIPVSPLRFLLHLLTHRPGRDRMPPFRLSSFTGGSYVGYAVK